MNRVLRVVATVILGPVAMVAIGVACAKLSDDSSPSTEPGTVRQPMVAPDGGWPADAAGLPSACNATPPAGVQYRYEGDPECTTINGCGVTKYACNDAAKTVQVYVCMSKDATKCSNTRACCALRHEFEHVDQANKYADWCRTNKPNDFCACVDCNSTQCRTVGEAEGNRTGCGCEVDAGLLATPDLQCQDWKSSCSTAKNGPDTTPASCKNLLAPFDTCGKTFTDPPCRCGDAISLAAAAGTGETDNDVCGSYWCSDNASQAKCAGTCAKRTGTGSPCTCTTTSSTTSSCTTSSTTSSSTTTTSFTSTTTTSSTTTTRTTSL